ncbi:hypothetical protein WM008_19780 [Vibrio vulnificus]|uniref:hypothetical protein n=1 Tax=Vibrio vulnificus TaxID=672 RepID=UPI002892FE81|nr:hypothetical protein [Vibrio vulnificus]WNJ73421.1 hypothetical protein RI132_23540 [Vibrio vulnificus]
MESTFEQDVRLAMQLSDLNKLTLPTEHKSQDYIQYWTRVKETAQQRQTVKE